ncbi:MAG: hypothetical protein JWM18_5154 [Chloroflexi bacterium]|jgi:hypothetical protein|nr:hypothetical protein [Chloroflexota bacterium]
MLCHERDQTSRPSVQVSTVHACSHCSIRGLDVFYLPASARWICPECGGAVSYPFLLRAADLREAQAVTRYRRATREP